MKRILLLLLLLFAMPVVAQEETNETTGEETFTQADCVDQLQLQRDDPDVLELVDSVRDILDQSATDDAQPIPLTPYELEALLFYANSDLSLDEAMIVIGENYESIIEVPEDIIQELLEQGDELDETEGDVSVPECNYIMYHGDITVACGGDTPFSTTQPTGNPPQPVRLTDRGSVLVWNAGQGIVINLTRLDDGDIYVGQLERPEVTFRYVVQETDDAYQGTIQQLPTDGDACPEMLVISNFTLQPFDEQVADAPDVEQDPLFEMDDIWDSEDE